MGLGCCQGNLSNFVTPVRILPQIFLLFVFFIVIVYFLKNINGGAETYFIQFFLCIGLLGIIKKNIVSVLKITTINKFVDYRKN